MAQANDTKGILYQNLVDAGCSTEMTDCCMTLKENGRESDMLKLLKRHRRDILDEIHEGQNKIDCLDYLIYQLMKSSR